MSTRPRCAEGRPIEMVAEAGEMVEAVAERLGSVVGPTLSQLRRAASSECQLEIEFGLRVSSSANLVIAHAGGDASHRVVVRSKGVDRDG